MVIPVKAYGTLSVVGADLMEGVVRTFSHPHHPTLILPVHPLGELPRQVANATMLALQVA